MRLVTCDRVVGVERPFLESHTAVNVNVNSNAKHWYTKNQISLNYDRLHGDLSHLLHDCLSSLDLSDKTTKEQYERLFENDRPFVVTLALLGSVAMMASTEMDNIRSSVAVEQKIRIQKLSNMMAAGGSLTIEQEAYLEMVMDGDYAGWLWWILGELIPIL